MRYLSTRGEAAQLAFDDVLLAGLATDGGLYTPFAYPHIAPADIVALAGVPYAEAATRLISPFLSEDAARAAHRAAVLGAGSWGTALAIHLSGVGHDVVLWGRDRALIEDMRAVSDAWLAAKAGREKRFSLGAFDPAYLARFPVALVRVEGRIVAFANIWVSGDGEEASCDLMRHHPDAPYGTMEMMMVRLIEWARRQGYERFNLGMAPLSGMPSGRLAPVWAQLGHALFDVVSAAFDRNVSARDVHN